MSKMQVATQFFHTCESLGGRELCADYVADDAIFSSQCEPLIGITSVLEYCDWMKAIGSGPLANCSYVVHASGFDEESSTACFFATFNGTHCGPGGPVEPTGKSTSTHYVYAITVGENGLVTRMTKVWNAPWALKELGWC